MWDGEGAWGWYDSGVIDNTVLIRAHHHGYDSGYTGLGLQKQLHTCRLAACSCPWQLHAVDRLLADSESIIARWPAQPTASLLNLTTPLIIAVAEHVGTPHRVGGIIGLHHVPSTSTIIIIVIINS